MLYLKGLYFNPKIWYILCFSCKNLNYFIFHNVGVRLDRVRGGRQKYKRRPEVENATYQSAPLPLTKESEKGGIYIFALSLVKITQCNMIMIISLGKLDEKWLNNTAYC